MNQLRRSGPTGALVFLSVVVLVLGAASAARAELRMSEAVVVDADELIDENLTLQAANIAMHGHVTGDLVAIGGTIVIDGVVEGDVLALGGQVTLTGEVGGDVRVLAGSTIVDGPVAGDVLAGGGMVVMGSTVDGDALLGAATLQVGGAIGRDVVGYGSDVQLDAAVSGDVDMEGEHLALGGRLRVDGDLDWTGAPGVTRAPGAVVGGVYAVHPVVPTPRWVGPLFAGLQLFVGMLVLGLLWLALFSGFVHRAMQTVRDRPLLCLGLGTLVVVGAPLLAVATMLFGFFFGGLMLAGVLLALFGIALSLTMPLVALVLGKRFSGRDADVLGLWLPYALVLALLAALVQVPVLGALVAVVVVVTGLGGLVLTLVPTFRGTTSPQLEPVGRPAPATTAPVAEAAQ
jgi:hypothetical protein